MAKKPLVTRSALRKYREEQAEAPRKTHGENRSASRQRAEEDTNRLSRLDAANHEKRRSTSVVSKAEGQLSQVELADYEKRDQAIREEFSKKYAEIQRETPKARRSLEKNRTRNLRHRLNVLLIILVVVLVIVVLSVLYL